ncbi:MAG TPA: QueT transporter family protein [Clostridiales bacterium]|nr:QueT transporter family protein [Clostridiales bacterium]
MRIKEVTKQGIIAALYAVISITLAPISFGVIQFRVAEMLMPLPYYNKKNIIGITLGCLIANLFSPLGIADVMFGTAATFLACILISKLKNKSLVGVIAALINGLVIGAELYLILGLPLLFSCITVAVGEFVVVQVGSIIMKEMEERTTLIQYFKA